MNLLKGIRMYSAEFGRFLSVDPLFEVMLSYKYLNIKLFTEQHYFLSSDKQDNQLGNFIGSNKLFA